MTSASPETLDPAIRARYQPVIGLEVHAQLLTRSKAYAGDPNEYGAEPNRQVGVITLAHPGALPKANKAVVDCALRMGLALGSEITRYNLYDRKNYFYPDLPKGYQITQDKTPICRGGHVTVTTKSGDERRIGVTRIHMEEDAGKSLHLPGAPESLIDLNRAGVPLIEIVSEPDIRTSEEASLYLQILHRLVRYLDICDGNMEEGSFRCDVNISVMPVGAEQYGQRVEVKNINSFRNVVRAIEHEIERQILLIERGERVEPETRNFDAGTGRTTALRSKETLNDYRYFPEPDLPPLIIDDAWIERVREAMPALPDELFARFTSHYGLPEYDARVLIDDKAIALYYEAVCQHTTHYKAASNWIMGPVKSALNESGLGLDSWPVAPDRLAGLIDLVEQGRITFSVARDRLLPAMRQSDKSAADLATELDLFLQATDGGLAPIIEEILNRYPDKVAEYRAGKKGLLGLFMGDLMKATKGKANPKEASAQMQAALEGTA